MDGYNVIHKIPRLRNCLKQNLEQARKALANFIITRAKGYDKNSIFIVFDGRDGIINIDPAISGIKCLYTKTKQGADDKIISMVKNSPNPRNITVISDDNYVANNCKAHGAKVKPVHCLLPQKPPPSQRKSPSSKGAEKIIDHKTADTITAMLRKEYGF